MFNRVFQLFKIARKLSTSGAIDTINQIYNLPLIINFFFNVMSIGSSKKNFKEQKTSGEKLCIALEGMGTTFIKLGQFLATRPDIIGEDLAKDLEKLFIKYKQKRSAIIYLYVSKKSIETRIENRIFCKKCQKTFNQLHNPSNLASHTCGTKYLTKRSDDNIDIILRRYDNYQKLANPLLEHYKKFPFFHEIDGSRKIDEISNEINTILSNIMN